MNYGMEIYYDEILCFGQAPQYKNFKYGGIIELEDDGYNELTVSMENGNIIRHYKHNIYIPSGIAMKIIEAGDLNKQSLPENCNNYDDNLYGYIRQTYFKQITIFISYLYEMIMRKLIEDGFIPYADDWYSNMGCGVNFSKYPVDIADDIGIDENAIPLNTVYLSFPDNVTMRFVGKLSKTDNTPVGFQATYSIAYIIHHMYITDNLLIQFSKSLNIAGSILEKDAVDVYVSKDELLKYNDIWKASDATEIHEIINAYLEADDSVDILRELSDFDINEDNDDESEIVSTDE